MRINSGLVLDGYRPIVTKQYEEEIYLGNPHNCIDILSDFNFDELQIINKSSIIDHDYIVFLGRIAASSKLPLSITGGISSIEIALHLIQNGYERLFLNFNLNNVMSIAQILTPSVGKQSVGLKLDLIYKNSKFTEFNTAIPLNEIVDSLKIKKIDKIFISEINFNIVNYDGINQPKELANNLYNKIKSLNCHKSITGGVMSKDLLTKYSNLNFDACYTNKIHSTDIYGTGKLANDCLVRDRK